jgi:mono/diheme cytochrome c family protein
MVYFRMISPRMSRAARAFLVVTASIGVAVVATACGTQKISVSQSQPNLYHGAVLFNQRCGGCHTLSYAATHGSAAKVTTAQFNNGPNFNVRCERPVARVLYAIENGGFSGAIMPQNVVVGQDAIDVADFVAKYSGRQAPIVPGSTVCTNEPIGTLPPPGVAVAAAGVAAGSASSASGATGPTGASGATGPNSTKKASAGAKAHHAKGKKS